VGYRKDSFGNIIRDGSTDVSWKLPGGGFHSTVVDLLRFCEGLRSEELLTAAQKAVAWTRQKNADGTNTSYGLGFALGSRSGRPLVDHTGLQQKSATEFRLYPNDGLCVVVMTNSDWADTQVVVRALEDTARASP
jgi:hypothetical protein